tara:strand:- start:1105 stop:1230 length:126 start_codon:yes stop_codon:yes gene_type:complete
MTGFGKRQDIDRPTGKLPVKIDQPDQSRTKWSRAARTIREM